MSDSAPPLEYFAGRVRLQHLPVVTPPVLAGGRIVTSAGEMAQVANGTTFRFLVYLEFPADGPVRGNHYHDRKVEHLYVIEGRLQAMYADPESGERFTTAIGPNTIVVVQPGIAHAYSGITRSHVMEWADTEYDPTDVHPFEC